MRADSESNQIYEAARQVLRDYKVAVLIVAYNAEKYIEKVLARIPVEIAELFAQIYVIDDSSVDRTYESTIEAGQKLNLNNLRVYRTPINRGYGGNQKLGYTYAVEHDFDFVVMLHGDGQYAPEYLPHMIAPFADGETDVVLGSRMLSPSHALKGGMPFYKWTGNQILTWFENKMLGVSLAEFHTGYRAFRVERLRQIPFKYNSDDFHFDTEILIQFLSAGGKITEVPIPTYYGDEISHVNGLHYAWNCVKSVMKYRLFNMGLFYDPLLDFNLFEQETYFFKKAPNSLHQYILGQDYSNQTVADLGAARGYISAEVAKQAASVVAVDYERPTQRSERVKTLSFDLNSDFDSALGFNRFDTVLALDVIEHLDNPEAAVQKIARMLKPGGKLLASTANVSFFIMRIMLLLGFFNYGKRGILDLTHKRLFTVSSFKHLLERYGFEVELVRGFSPPIRDMISSRWPFSWIDSILSWLARIMPSLFSFNFLLVAKRKPSLDEIYQATLESNNP